MKKNLYLLALLLLCSVASIAQRSTTTLIEPISEAQVRFEGSQSTKYRNMSTNDMYKAVSLVRMGNLPAIQEQGILTFDIPGRRGSISAKVKSLEAVSETEYVWVGELTKGEGTVMIIAREGRVFGHITVDKDAYEIHDLGNQTNVLVHINDAMFTGKECATVHKDLPKQGLNTSDGVGTLNHHLAVIRILVLFTQNAANAVANINDVAFLAVQQMNTALVNSNVANVDVALAGVQALAFTESATGDIFTDVNNLSNNANAQALRNTFEADIVLLLTNGNYGSTFGVVADIGPNNALAYGIVEVDAASGRYTFAHEAAHLVGARHDTDPDPGFAHGHNFKTGIWPFQTTRRTILNSLPSGESRILHYSNPDVEYKNKDTGTGSRNNARQLVEQSPTVAAFRDFTPPLAVNISGPVFGDNSGTYTWSSSVSNGVPPYTYRWDYSLDGFTYNLFATTPSVTAQLPLDMDLHLRLTVTDNAGAQAVDFHTTSNNDGGNCIKCLADGVNAEGKTAITQDAVTEQYVIFPNPSQKDVNVHYTVATAGGDVTFAVADFSGNEVLRKTISHPESGKFVSKIDVSGLRSGQYILKIQSGEILETKRLLVSEGSR